MLQKLLCLFGFHQVVNRVVNFEGIKSHSFVETKCQHCGANFSFRSTHYRPDAEVID
jgi:hypothetical protein